MHGSPWPSDNGRVALSAHPLHVADWVGAAYTAASENPGAWVSKILGNVPLILRSVMLALAEAFLIPLALIGLVVLRRRRIDPLLAGLTVLAMAPVGLMTVLGYDDVRYHTLWLSLLCLTMLCALMGRPETPPLPRVARSAVFVVIAVVAAVLWLDRVAPAERRGGGFERIVEACTPGVLVVLDSAAETARYGALTGERAVYPPRNWARLSDGERAAFLETFGVTHILLSRPSTASPPATLAQPAACAERMFVVTRTAG